MSEENRKMDTTSERVEKTFALSLATMLNTILGIVLSMVLTRVLTKGELAAYKQTFLAYETFAPFLSLGITSGLNYILVKYSEKKRGMTNASVVILTAMGAVYALFILLGGNRLLSVRFSNDMVANLLMWMIPYAIIVTPSTIGTAVMVNQGRIRLCSIFSVFSKLAHYLIVIIAVLIFKSASSAVIGNVAANILVALLTLFVIYRFVLPKDISRFDGKDMVNILKFSLPLGIAAMVGTLDVQLDKFIVSSLLSPEAFAVYSVGAQELPLIGTITGSLSAVVAVDIATSLKENRYDDALFLFKKIAKTTSLFLFPIAIFCFVFAKDIVATLYTESYLSAVDVFRIYLLRVPASTVIYAPLLIGLGKGNKVLQRSILSLIANAVLSFFFVKYLGAYGAALGTIIVCYTILIPFNLHAIGRGMDKKWKELLPFGHYLKVSLAMIPSALICAVTRQLLLPYLQSHILMICVCGVLFCLLIALTYKLFFRLDVIQICVGYVKSKLKKGA
jgi:O-antigen/teichoic acid export membrane protein